MASVPVKVDLRKGDSWMISRSRGSEIFGRLRFWGLPTSLRFSQPGSKPLWSNALRPPPARRPVTSRRSSIACAPAGAKKAFGAVAASILTAAYEMLKSGALYEDLGSDHFDKRARSRHSDRLVHRLQDLGYAVQITPLAA